MAVPPGNYNLQQALNNITLATKRFKLGDWVNQVTNAVNAMAMQGDIGMAIDAGTLTYGTAGTLTVAGSIANGNYFNVSFVNASIPSLVSPGVTVGPINIVTADTVTTVAAKLVAAMNANPTLTNNGVVASNAAGVVSYKVPGAAASSTVATAALSSGAVITVTPVAPTAGAGAFVPRDAAAYPLTPLSSL